MEQNNFEKHVQQKMDELKISPSESAWLNIEKRISKHGKQRKIAFILFFSALFFLTGGYWLFNSTKNTNAIPGKQASFIKNHAEILKEKKLDSSFNLAVISNKGDSDSNENSISKISSPYNIKNAKNKKPIILIHKKSEIILNESFLKSETKNEIFSDNKINKRPDVQDLPNLENKQNNFLHEKIGLAKQDKKSNEEFGNSSPEKNNQDSIENITSLLKIRERDSSFSDKNPNISLIENQKRKWKFGITFSGGMSFLANGFLDVNNNDNNYMSAPNSGSTGGYTPPSSLPVNTRGSLAFIGGAFFEKNISEKTKISLGVNYKYFSTVSKTGSKIDSALIAYNSTAYTNNYRNNFNYLEFPVSLKFKLNKNKLLPLFWNAGINISQLISSNALQFKTNNGVYYIDNLLFNKTQLGFSTGFSATLFPQQKYPVSIGPYFYYNASRLANQGLYGKKHFNFIGISTEVLFN
jgi:hypothetical protein